MLSDELGCFQQNAVAQVGKNVECVPPLQLEERAQLAGQYQTALAVYVVEILVVKPIQGAPRS